MTPNNIKNTVNPYPIEQAFKFPLVITALLVLIPGLALYWFLGESSSVPRAFKLFFGNWISPIILWFFVASFFHLLLKKSKLKKEQLHSNLLANRVFPTLIDDTDSTDSTDSTDNQLYSEIEKASQQQSITKNNLLLSRLSLFINHHEDDIDDTFGIKEREQMKGSFSLPRFMVWAIPILGFIGTVWGISNGIAHFSDAMTSTNSVTDVSAMLKENLPLVTNSLATAFDTTLLALLLSIPLMMLMLTQEKSEEAYLIELDETWFHNIKPALQSLAGKVNLVASQGAGAGAMQGTMQGTIPETMQAATLGTGSATSDASTQAVANEIKLLSSQIKALQETMEDLYETIFTSKLSDKQ